MTKLTVLKASWINRLLDTKCMNRVFWIAFNILFSFHRYILKTTEMDFKNLEITLILPTLYREILCSFNSFKKLKFLNQFSSYEILHEPIWNNKMFTYKNKTFFWKFGKRKTIVYVCERPFWRTRQSQNFTWFCWFFFLNKKWLCE